MSIMSYIQNNSVNVSYLSIFKSIGLVEKSYPNCTKAIQNWISGLNIQIGNDIKFQWNTLYFITDLNLNRRLGSNFQNI